MSTPSTARISSARSMHSADSNCTITMVASLSAAYCCFAGKLRYWKCGSAVAKPRSPSGGYLAALTASRPCSGVRTSGTMMPSAPPSSTRCTNSSCGTLEYGGTRGERLVGPDAITIVPVRPHDLDCVMHHVGGEQALLAARAQAERQHAGRVTGHRLGREAARDLARAVDEIRKPRI